MRYPWLRSSDTWILAVKIDKSGGGRQQLIEFEIDECVSLWDFNMVYRLHKEGTVPCAHLLSELLLRHGGQLGAPLEQEGLDPLLQVGRAVRSGLDDEHLHRR